MSPFKNLNEAYRKSVDSLGKIIIYSRFVNENYLNIDFSEKVPYYLLLMKLEISRLMLDVNTILAIESPKGWGFIPVNISFTNKDVSRNGYSVTLATEIGQKSNYRQLKIDTVFYEEQLIASPFLVEPNYSVLNLSADSLKKGKYQINGYLLYGEQELFQKKHFTHNFEIK